MVVLVGARVGAHRGLEDLMRFAFAVVVEDAGTGGVSELERVRGLLLRGDGVDGGGVGPAPVAFLDQIVVGRIQFHQIGGHGCAKGISSGQDDLHEGSRVIVRGASIPQLSPDGKDGTVTLSQAGLGNRNGDREARDRRDGIDAERIPVPVQQLGIRRICR